MLHSFKHAAPASVRRPSQDGYRPRTSESRPSGDFRRTAHERQSLDVRRPRHSFSDLYRPSQRRASEPGRRTYSDNVRWTGPARQTGGPLESPKEEDHLTEINAVPVFSPSPAVSPTTSPTAIESTQDLDGSVSPNALPSLEKHDVDERPPPLPYCLWDHKLSISFFWFLILAESCFVPVSLYYGLIYGTNLRHGALFAIITSVFGFITGYEYTCRGYLLLKKSDKYRPLNDSPRFWAFDTLHWLLSGPYAVMTGVLIGGSIPHEPLQRVLATPMALGFIIVGIIFVINGVAVQQRWRLKYFRMSSHVKGAVTPPITYSIIEDAVAVDGGGGRRYRTALMMRYTASPKFRALLRDMTWFWGISSLLVGLVLMALIFTVKREVAYGLGWGVPAIWAGIWTLITIVWVRKVLRDEERDWNGPVWLDPEGQCGIDAAVEMEQGNRGSVSGTTV